MCDPSVRAPGRTAGNRRFGVPCAQPTIPASMPSLPDLRQAVVSASGRVQDDAAVGRVDRVTIQWMSIARGSGGESLCVPIWLYRAGLGSVFGSRTLMLEHVGRK